MPTTLRKPLRKVGKAPKNARKQRAAASGLPLGSIHRSDTPLVYASPITHGVDADDAEEAQRVVKRAMERRRGDGAFDPYLRKYAALPQHTASQRRLRRAYILHDIAMLLAVLVPALWWWGARVAARVRPQLRFYCVGPSSGAATPRALVGPMHSNHWDTDLCLRSDSMPDRRLQAERGDNPVFLVVKTVVGIALVWRWHS